MNPIKKDFNQTVFEINKENIKFSYDNNNNNSKDSITFNYKNSKIQFILNSENQTISISLYLVFIPPITNGEEISLKLEIEKKQSYFLNLHEDYIIFKRNIKSIYDVLIKKIIISKYILNLNFTENNLNFLKKIQDFKEDDIHKTLFDNMTDFTELFIFSNLDEEEIKLNIKFDENIAFRKNNKEFATINLYDEELIKNDLSNLQDFYYRVKENEIVRKAKETDSNLVLSFIKEIADYEKLLNQVTGTSEILTESIFKNKYAEVLIYEVRDKPVAFALFFHNFSTFKCRPGLYLEDIYVKPEYRKSGIGSFFFKLLAKIAVERKCGRFEWVVLNWNVNAIEFYRKMGAFPMSEWTTFRLDEDNFKKLAES